MENLILLKTVSISLRFLIITMVVLDARMVTMEYHLQMEFTFNLVSLCRIVFKGHFTMDWIFLLNFTFLAIDVDQMDMFHFTSFTTMEPIYNTDNLLLIILIHGTYLNKFNKHQIKQ